MLFQNSEFGLDAPTFADVGIFRQTVRCAHDIRPQPQTLPTGAAIRTWRLRLQPVEQRKAQLLCAIEVFFCLGLAHVANQAEGIIILRPVHDSQVAPIKSRREQIAVGDAAVGPEAFARLGIKPDLIRVVSRQSSKNDNPFASSVSS